MPCICIAQLFGFVFVLLSAHCFLAGILVLDAGTFAKHVVFVFVLLSARRLYSVTVFMTNHDVLFCFCYLCTRRFVSIVDRIILADRIIVDLNLTYASPDSIGCHASAHDAAARSYDVDGRAVLPHGKAQLH